MRQIWRSLGLAVAVSAAVLTVAPAPASAAADPYAYLVVSRLSNKCLNVKDWSQQVGGAVQMWTCTADTNGRWVGQRVDSTNYRLRLAVLHSGLCLTVQDDATWDGAPVVQGSCGAASSVWVSGVSTVPSGVVLMNQHSGKCLNVANWGTDNGTPVQQWTCSSSDLNNIWSLT